MAQRTGEKQRDMILEIRDRTIRMEEHLKSINGNIVRHEARITSNEKAVSAIDKKQERLNTWYRVKSWILVIVSGVLGSVVTWLITLLRQF